MSLKFTEKLSIMTMKNNAQFERGFTCCFKIEMRNLTNFGPNTQMSQVAIFDQNIQSLSKKMFELKSTEELCLIALKIDAKF